MAFISAILTAAGESTRMGRPKPLLRWHGTTLLEHQVKCLIDGGAAEVVVVLGHLADSIARHIREPRASHVRNPRYRQGKTTSIKAGLEAVNPETQGYLLLAVDQPRTSEIISKVVRAHIDADALITSPRYQGRGGHPLIFSSSLKEDLLSITEENQGIREVFQAHRKEVNEIEVEDPMLRLDLNTLEDYEEARLKYGA